jgi:hypothetical protein
MYYVQYATAQNWTWRAVCNGHFVFVADQTMKEVCELFWYDDSEWSKVMTLIYIMHCCFRQRRRWRRPAAPTHNTHYTLGPQHSVMIYIMTFILYIHHTVTYILPPLYTYTPIYLYTYLYTIYITMYLILLLTLLVYYTGTSYILYSTKTHPTATFIHTYYVHVHNAQCTFIYIHIYIYIYIMYFAFFIHFLLFCCILLFRSNSFMIFCFSRCTVHNDNVMIYIAFINFG